MKDEQNTHSAAAGSAGALAKEIALAKELGRGRTAAGVVTVERCGKENLAFAATGKGPYLCVLLPGGARRWANAAFRDRTATMELTVCENDAIEYQALLWSEEGVARHCGGGKYVFKTWWAVCVAGAIWGCSRDDAKAVANGVKPAEDVAHEHPDFGLATKNKFVFGVGCLNFAPMLRSEDGNRVA